MSFLGEEVPQQPGRSPPVTASFSVSHVLARQLSPHPHPDPCGTLSKPGVEKGANPVVGWLLCPVRGLCLKSWEPMLDYPVLVLRCLELQCGTAGFGLRLTASHWAVNILCQTAHGGIPEVSGFC